MRRALYNFVTWVWHRLLRVPIRMRAVVDRRVEQPVLTVVFLHGISADSGTWRVTLRQLEQNSAFARVRFVALDLLGFGHSLRADWLDYDYHDYDQALAVTLRHLKINTPVVLVGHSMGALIAAHFASNPANTFHLAQLILVSPPVLLADELARLPDQAYTKTYSALHKIAVDVPAAETVAKFVQKFSSFRSSYIKSEAFARSMEQIILNSRNFQTFTHLRVPTLLIHGHFDPLVLGANLRRAARENSTYLRYQSVIGHHDISAGKRAKIEAELKKVKELYVRDQTV